MEAAHPRVTETLGHISVSVRPERARRQRQTAQLPSRLRDGARWPRLQNLLAMSGDEVKAAYMWTVSPEPKLGKVWRPVQIQVFLLHA